MPPTEKVSVWFFQLYSSLSKTFRQVTFYIITISSLKLIPWQYPDSQILSTYDPSPSSSNKFPVPKRDPYEGMFYRGGLLSSTLQIILSIEDSKRVLNPLRYDTHIKEERALPQVSAKREDPVPECMDIV